MTTPYERFLESKTVSAPELSLDELKAVILSRKMEVLSILFWDATINWASAHVQKAAAEGDMARLKAEVSIFESAIERERKRTEPSE